MYDAECVLVCPDLATLLVMVAETLVPVFVPLPHLMSPCMCLTGEGSSTSIVPPEEVRVLMGNKALMAAEGVQVPR